MIETSPYDPVLAKGYEVFTEDFTLYHSADKLYLDRHAMAYALLYKWKRDSTVEVLWRDSKVKYVLLHDGHSVPVEHVSRFVLFYKEKEWESTYFHTAFNNRQKRAMEAAGLLGMLVSTIGEEATSKLMYEELR